MQKHNNSGKKSEPTSKRTKLRGPVQRDRKEVLAEVLGKLAGKLSAPAELTRAKENRRGNTVGPNRDRLTVGVDLGDRWRQYCILGLAGETLAEGQLRTTQEDVREFFQALTGGAGSPRSGNSLGLGTGRDRRAGTRSAGGEPAVDGRVEAS